MKGRLSYLIIYMLTVIDVVLTHFGIRNGIIEEANPLMAFLLEKDQYLTYGGILAGVALILYFIYKNRAGIKWISKAMKLVLAAKLMVLVFHIQWIPAVFK